MTKFLEELTLFDIIEIVLVIIIFIFDTNSYLFYFSLVSLCIYDAFDIIKDIRKILNPDVNNKSKIKALGGILLIIWPIFLIL